MRINTLDDSDCFGHTVKPSRVKRLAVTGGIACGKSLFSTYLSDLGCEVLDADEVVHRLEASGGRAIPAIVGAFGSGMLGADGAIRRETLGSLVFSNPSQRERLNAIVHPLVREELDAWFRRASTGRLRFAVIPLLFEVGWREDWDFVVCLACRPPEQMRRLRERGLTEEEAAARIGAQLPIGEKARLADRVVWNDGSLEALRREAERLVRDLSESHA